MSATNRGKKNLSVLNLGLIALATLQFAVIAHLTEALGGWQTALESSLLAVGANKPSGALPTVDIELAVPKLLPEPVVASEPFVVVVSPHPAPLLLAVRALEEPLVQDVKSLEKAASIAAAVVEEAPSKRKSSKHRKKRARKTARSVEESVKRADTDSSTGADRSIASVEDQIGNELDRAASIAAEEVYRENSERRQARRKRIMADSAKASGVIKEE